MDFRPPSLLLLLPLTSLLHLSVCAVAEPYYIIDSVSLKILPGNTVQSGTPVTFICNATIIQGNMPNLMQTFHLKQDGIPIHSSTTIDDTVTYELNPARAADSGTYECQVKVKEKHKVSFYQKLDVTGLQTPILDLDKTSFYAGEDFTATCSAKEEKGSLRFSFFQRFVNEEPQKIKQVAPTGNSSETTMILRDAGDYFLSCNYEITLVSGTRSSLYSNETRVIVKALHIAPTMNVLPSDTVYEGEIIEVVCKVVNTLRNVNVYLTKGRSALKTAPVSLIHRLTAKEGDSGELVCKAEWGNVQKETYHTITVKELVSKPRLTVEPLEIFEGDHFKLTCSVDIYVPEKIQNKTLQFSIYKNNEKLNCSDTYFDVASNSTNGNYSCKAEVRSMSHNFIKDSPTVVIKAKVLVSKPVLSVVGGTVVLEKPFQLMCHSDRGDLPINYTLHTPDKKTFSKKVYKPGDQAIFNSSAIFKISDLSDFLCLVKNNNLNAPVAASGLELLTSTNIIEPVSTPVLRHSMSDISEGDDVTLNCSVAKGTLPIIFTWYHTETEDALSKQTSNKLYGLYRIQNVKRMKGGYYCMSTNSASDVKRSKTVMITVKLAGWKKGLIAVFCILVILALFLFIAFKTRLLQYKRKRTTDLSVKSASTKLERLSLTLAEVNQDANVTPGMMGKSVWSDHVSGSESDDQLSVTEPQNTEVKTRQADANGVRKSTDVVYSEVRHSQQGTTYVHPALHLNPSEKPGQWLKFKKKKAPGNRI